MSSSEQYYPSTFPAEEMPRLQRHKLLPLKVDFAIEHDCELLSTCCGAGTNEYVENFCNACNEYADFECECAVG
jgi:hypothetical protein